MMTPFKQAKDFLTYSLNRKDRAYPAQVLFSDIKMKHHREKLLKNVAWLVANC